MKKYKIQKVNKFVISHYSLFVHFNELRETRASEIEKQNPEGKRDRFFGANSISGVTEITFGVRWCTPRVSRFLPEIGKRYFLHERIKRTPRCKIKINDKSLNDKNKRRKNIQISRILPRINLQ